MTKLKSNIIFLFFILAGIIFGSLIAGICTNISLLSWLSYGNSIGIAAANPMVLDLAVIKIAFGFEMSINIAQIICIILALICYRSFGRKL